MIVEFLRIEGMRNERDRRLIKASLSQLDGIERVVINLAAATVSLERSEACSLAAIIAALEAAGYRVAVMA